MTDIPADVMEAACEALNKAAATPQMGNFEPETVIARAILAERERCAAVVDDAAKLRRDRAEKVTTDPDHSTAKRMAHELEFVAAAIRGGQ